MLHVIVDNTEVAACFEPEAAAVLVAHFADRPVEVIDTGEYDDEQGESSTAAWARRMVGVLA